MDIIKALTREAHAAGICEDHFKQMLTEDTHALFDHFKTMIQECTFSGFPSVELIRACWDKKDLNAAGIFVQQTVDTEAVQGVDVFGFARGRFGLRSGPWCMPMLHTGATLNSR